MPLAKLVGINNRSQKAKRALTTARVVKKDCSSEPWSVCLRALCDRENRTYLGFREERCVRNGEDDASQDIDVSISPKDDPIDLIEYGQLLRVRGTDQFLRHNAQNCAQKLPIFTIGSSCLCMLSA